MPMWCGQSKVHKVIAAHRKELTPPNQPKFTSKTDPDSLAGYVFDQFPKQIPDSEFPYGPLAPLIMLWGWELTGPRSEDRFHQFYRQHMGTGSSGCRTMTLLQTTGLQKLLNDTDGSQVKSAFLRYYEILESTEPCGSDTAKKSQTNR